MFDAGPETRPDLPGQRATVPGYLERHYWWAYLRPASIAIFDHPAVVSAILWGNYRRLSDKSLARIPKRARVLQLACVYGDLSARLADRIGPSGRLDIVDAAAIQVANVDRKLAHFPWAHARQGDAAELAGAAADCVLCFFLLHELPQEQRKKVVAVALDHVNPGGKAIFVDYHKPRWWHPLRPVSAAVFALLEPFAAGMWRQNIQDLADDKGAFSWSRELLFGGLFQIVVAQRRNGRNEANSGN
jgi:SAM-dependent methyltransferase